MGGGGVGHFCLDPLVPCLLPCLLVTGIGVEVGQVGNRALNGAGGKGQMQGCVSRCQVMMIVMPLLLLLFVVVVVVVDADDAHLAVDAVEVEQYI